MAATFDFKVESDHAHASFEHIMSILSPEITKYLSQADQHRLALSKAEWWRRIDQTSKPIPEIGQGTDTILGELSSVHHWDVSRRWYIMAATVVSREQTCQLCVVCRNKPNVVVTYSFPGGDSEAEEEFDEKCELWRVAISDGLPVIYLDSEEFWPKPKIYRCVEQGTTLQAVTPWWPTRQKIIIGVAYVQGHMFILYKTDSYKSIIGIFTKPRGADTEWVDRRRAYGGQQFHFYGGCEREMTVNDKLTVYCMVTPPQANVIQIVVAHWKAVPIIRTITVDDPQRVTVHRLSAHAPCLIVTDQRMCELPRMVNVEAMLPANGQPGAFKWLDEPPTPDRHEFTLHGRVVITKSGEAQVPVKYEPNKSSRCKDWYPVMMHTARGVDGKVVTAFVDNKGVYYAIVKTEDSVIFRKCAPTPTWKTIGRRACGINPEIHASTHEDQQTCTHTFKELMSVGTTRKRVQEWAQTGDGPLATCIRCYDSAKLDTMLKIIKPTSFPEELWRMSGTCSSAHILKALATYATTHFGESAALQGTELALGAAVKDMRTGFLSDYHARKIEPQKSLAWWVQNSPTNAFLKSIAPAYSRT